MNKIYILILSAFFGFIILGGCEQNDIMSYQEEYTAVNFISDSTSYSFLGNAEDQYTEEVIIRINGDSTSADRPFEVEVIDDSLTTAEPSDYDIGEGVVPAGEFEGVLPVTVFNSDKLSDTTVSLHLRLTSSADFKIGRTESRDFVLRWTDKVILPSWTYYRYFFCSYPSTTAYEIIVELTDLTEITSTQLREIGQNGLIAYGRQFGDYVKEYNKNHPDNPLVHEDGAAVGEPIEPIYYTQSQYD